LYFTKILLFFAISYDNVCTLKRTSDRKNVEKINRERIPGTPSGKEFLFLFSCSSFRETSLLSLCNQIIRNYVRVKTNFFLHVKSLFRCYFRKMTSIFKKEDGGL